MRRIGTLPVFILAGEFARALDCVDDCVSMSRHDPGAYRTIRLQSVQQHIDGALLRWLRNTSLGPVRVFGSYGSVIDRKRERYEGLGSLRNGWRLWL